MAQQLKRWESPRHEGRNHKGRGGSAKARQYMKRQKRLRKRLQEGINSFDKASAAQNPEVSCTSGTSIKQINLTNKKERLF
jgi:hypothetical protein